MKALLFDEATGPAALYVGEAPDPTIGPDDVLIAVVAASVNRADLLQLHGNYPGFGAKGEILGLDLAGTVIEVGANVQDLEIGDNVCALVDRGGYAQRAAVPASMCLKLPESLSFTKAAALPEVFLVAYQALSWLGDVHAGDDVLIHAGAGGVGTAMIQIAKKMGATVFVSASKRKHEYLVGLGADYCIDYKKEDFAEFVLQKTDGKGVEVLIDFIGDPYAKQNLKALAVDGTEVILGLMGGKSSEGLSAVPIVLKRLTIVGSTLRNRPLEYKEVLMEEFRETVWPLFTDRQLLPVVDTIYDWEDAPEAFEYMAGNGNIGKLVLTIGAA